MSQIRYILAAIDDMEMDNQFISIYGKFVTSQTAYFSSADNNM